MGYINSRQFDFKMFKSERLRAIECDVQNAMSSDFFEVDDKFKEGDSYMVTFPYPYMNGSPHMGHALTLSKAEFAAAHRRLKGKKVLFPFAFHATGMPIKSSADKLRRELDAISKNVTNGELNVSKMDCESSDIKTGYHSSKSKLSSKVAGKSQIEVMRQLGIKDEDIYKFVDPWYWVEYFMPEYKRCVSQLGLSIDWTRSFVTTDKNRYYSNFIKWQFTKLKEQGKLKYGERYTIYSVKDGQPCQDHDRSSGEGVVPLEYTLVKFEVDESSTSLKDMKQYMAMELETKNRQDEIHSIFDNKISLLAATLRPETMFGLTNVWVNPNIQYGVYFHVFEDNVEDIVIVTERASINMTHQGHSMKHICNIAGSQLLGLKVKAMYCPFEYIYVLPMPSILDKKGTGIVSSVPSESVDDYLNVIALQNENHPFHKEMFTRYPVLTEEMIKFNVVSIIETEFDGKQTHEIAIDFCKKHNIKNVSALNDISFKDAKKNIYNASRKGKFIAGVYTGMSVQTVIGVVEHTYTEQGYGFKYAEPESTVISRSGDDCCVALLEQWYINYGEPEWKSQVMNHVNKMEFPDEKTRHYFQEAVDWVGQWACTRTYGLGTVIDSVLENSGELPQMVCSLSDSTVYMAYYTVSNLIESLPIDMVSNELFDYIFLGKELSVKYTESEYMDSIFRMRKQFEFFYPMDLRVSGKDLIQNHLVFCLYNHIAIWGNDETKLPKSFRTNGHITINGEKMAKSVGNFITLDYLLKNYSADAIRLTLASGSDDPLEDTNYKDDKTDGANMPDLVVLNASVLSLYTLSEWLNDKITKLNSEPESFRSGDYNTFDYIMIANIKQSVKETDESYKKLRFYDAIQSSYYRMNHLQNQYHCFTGDYHIDVLRYFIENLLIITSPVIPHITEYYWQMFNKHNYLTKYNSVRYQSFPDVNIDYNDKKYMKIGMYFNIIMDAIGQNKKMWLKKNTNMKATDITHITISVGDIYTKWMKEIMDSLQAQIDKMTTFLCNMTMKDLMIFAQKDTVVQSVCAELNISVKKRVIPYLTQIIKEAEQNKTNSVYELYELENLNYYELLSSNILYIANYTGHSIEIKYVEDINPSAPVIKFHCADTE